MHKHAKASKRWLSDLIHFVSYIMKICTLYINKAVWIVIIFAIMHLIKYTDWNVNFNRQYSPSFDVFVLVELTMPVRSYLVLYKQWST